VTTFPLHLLNYLAKSGRFLVALPLSLPIQLPTAQLPIAIVTLRKSNLEPDSGIVARMRAESCKIYDEKAVGLNLMSASKRMPFLKDLLQLLTTASGTSARSPVDPPKSAF